MSCINGCSKKRYFWGTPLLCNMIYNKIWFSFVVVLMHLIQTAQKSHQRVEVICSWQSFVKPDAVATWDVHTTHNKPSCKFNYRASSSGFTNCFFPVNSFVIVDSFRRNHYLSCDDKTVSRVALLQSWFTVVPELDFQWKLTKPSILLIY